MRRGGNGKRYRFRSKLTECRGTVPSDEITGNSIVVRNAGRSAGDFPCSFFQHFPVGDIMARATNDLLALRMVAGPAVMYLVDTTVRTIMIVPMMASISPSKWPAWMRAIGEAVPAYHLGQIGRAIVGAPVIEPPGKAARSFSRNAVSNAGPPAQSGSDRCR